MKEALPRLVVSHWAFVCSQLSSLRAKQGVIPSERTQGVRLLDRREVEGSLQQRQESREGAFAPRRQLKRSLGFVATSLGMTKAIVTLFFGSLFLFLAPPSPALADTKCWNGAVGRDLRSWRLLLEYMYE